MKKEIKSLEELVCVESMKVLRNGDIRRFILSSFPFITLKMGPAYWAMMTHNFMLNHTMELSYE